MMKDDDDVHGLVLLETDLSWWGLVAFPALNDEGLFADGTKLAAAPGDWENPMGGKDSSSKFALDGGRRGESAI